METCRTCHLPYKLYKPYMGEMCDFGGNHSDLNTALKNKFTKTTHPTNSIDIPIPDEYAHALENPLELLDDPVQDNGNSIDIEPEEILEGYYRWVIHCINIGKPDHEKILGTGTAKPLNPTEALQAIKALYRKEIEEAIGLPTQTFHSENGLSDYANMEIDIAITDLIKWVERGNHIDDRNREWFKEKVVKLVPADFIGKGKNELRVELRAKLLPPTKGEDNE